MRPTGESALASTAAAFRAARAADDREGLVDLVSERPLLAWFAVAPPELLEGLTVALAGRDLPVTAERHVAASFLRILRGEPLPTVLPEPLQALGLAVRAMQERLRGAPSAAVALHLSARATHAAGTAHFSSALFDTTQGFAAFDAMQLGVSRMLAGDLIGALVEFAAVEWNPSASLMFLTRDAHTKAALIHALYGSVPRADFHLGKARAAARTDSWVEAGIDANLELVEAILDTDAASAIERLERLPLSASGELWPFQVESLYRAYARADRGGEIALRLERLQPVAPVTEVRDGMPGNIFGSVFALDAFLRGDHTTARRLRAASDPAFFRARMMGAMLDTVSGRAVAALDGLTALRPQTEGLDQLEGQRLALKAQALHALERADDTLAALQDLNDLPARAGALGARLLGPPLHALAREAIADWTSSDITIWPDAPLLLTDRERELAIALCSDLTRAEIAAKLFLSENTVKTHQRSLFRKLGVSTRAQAAAVAERRGLV